MDQQAIQPYYQSLESIYAPQRQLIQQQIKTLPQQYAMERSGLEQAKANAFRDIASTARGRGMTFSGYTPSEQARYTGATYLPTLGKIQQAQTEGLTSLQSALNQLYGTQQKEAMGLWSDAQQRAEQKRQWEAEMAEKRRQFNLSLNAGGGGGGTVADPYAGFNVVANKDKDTGKTTGYSFFGPGNQPITAAQYYSSTGTGLSGLANFLRTDSDKTSQKAYKALQAVNNAVSNGLVSRQEGMQSLINKYPWIFGG